MNTFLTAALSLSALMGSSMVAAQSIDYLPTLDQCAGLYTVQKRGCTVEHILKCDVPEGTFWRNDTWSPEDGTDSVVSTLDANDVFYSYEDDEVGFVRIIETTDAPSNSRLINTGRDEFDVTIGLKLPFFVEPVPGRFMGFAEVTGEQVDIDGVIFIRARSYVSGMVNALEFSGYDELYIDAETGATVSGGGELAMVGWLEEYPGTPVQVIKPDEPGFLRNEGRFDCDFTS